MRVLLLDGNPDPAAAAFAARLEAARQALAERGHEVQLSRLRELSLRHCAGCWSCWVRTPGECAFEDDSGAVCRDVMASDLVVFASPVVMGFVTALTRTANEKLLPLVHPFMEIVDGETRHEARYPRYPLLALLLAPGDDTDDEDIEIISDVYRRNALNLNTRLCLTARTDRPPEELARAVDGL